jgi:hypothetical protein
LDEKMLIGGRDWMDTIADGIDDIFSRGGYMVEFWNSKAENNKFMQVEKTLSRREVIIADLSNGTAPDSLKDLENYIGLVDENGLNNNRLDDLIVRLYWLIFRNQFPELIV